MEIGGKRKEPGEPTAHTLARYRCFLPDLAGWRDYVAWDPAQEQSYHRRCPLSTRHTCRVRLERVSVAAIPEEPTAADVAPVRTRIGFVSLGCPKNLVDSEVMMACCTTPALN